MPAFRSFVASLVLVAAVAITTGPAAGAAEDFSVTLLPPTSFVGQWTTVPNAITYGLFVMEDGQSSGTWQWCQCTSLTATGTRAGHSYTTAAVAVTSSGWTQRGSTQTIAIPAAAPSAPSVAIVFPRNGGVDVSWEPPQSDGGGVTSYRVAATDRATALVSSATACGTCTSYVLNGLLNGHSYQVTVTATSQAGTGPTADAGTVTPGPVPGAPTSVTATPLTNGSGVTVKWVAAAGTDYVEVRAYDSGNSWMGTRLGLGSLGQLTYDGLPAGKPVRFEVWSRGNGGLGQPGTTGYVTVPNPLCGASACVGVDGRVDVGAFGGSNTGIQMAQDISPDAINQAGVRTWRLSPTAANIQKARSVGARAIGLVSEAWGGATSASNGGHPVSPWTNWSQYEQWLRNLVQQLKDTASLPEWWDIVNEPDGGLAYDPNFPATTELVAQQLTRAFNVIRSVDPSAKIIGPSETYFRYGLTPFSYDRIMALLAKTGTVLDGFSWHWNFALMGNGGPTSVNPVADDVASFRTVLSRYPTLGNPAIVFTEFGSAQTHMLPGWSAATSAVMERVGVTMGNRSCWGTAECAGYAVGGYLISGTTQTPAYWAGNLYSRLSGRRTLATSTDRFLTGLPVWTGLSTSTPSLQVLLGSTLGCEPAVNAWCGLSRWNAPGPRNVTVAVAWPTARTSVTVYYWRVPAASGGAAMPTPSGPFPVPVTNGVALVSVPNLGPTEAVLIQVS